MGAQMAAVGCLAGRNNYFKKRPVGKYENPIMFRGLAGIFKKPPQIACTSTGWHKETVTPEKICSARFFSQFFSIA